MGIIPPIRVLEYLGHYLFTWTLKGMGVAMIFTLYPEVIDNLIKTLLINLLSQ